MQTIIELIFGNIFFVALIIGGIISLINRNRTSQEQSSGQGQQGKEEKKEIDWKSIFQQEDEETSSPQRPTKPVPEAEGELVKPDVENSGPAQHEQYSKQMEELRKKQEEAREKVEKVGRSTVHDNALDQAATGVDSRQTGSRSRFAPTSRSDAIQGVVWSEILGEPKARRPYPNNGMKRYQKRTGSN
ncbi:hypothetical protein J2S78_002172 [Salibacterium salarium]|uniref:hypothetical protein n=1 Tax=Salibacterium salarium TaxID=284579 RepID=UPI00277D6C63|nr:hypothetical protein [Salibacterium salarium]MDQ0299752.1 hypothetical protein [Salibacterium salarium]